MRFTRLWPLVLALAFGACNQEKKVQYAEDPGAETAGGTVPGRRTFTYDAVLDGSASLRLAADATAFQMTLSGCASTQTTTVDETKTYLELYEFDRNCVVKLTTFTLNGNVYTPKAGHTFTSWAAGDTAVFEVVGASPADELKVEVITTVSNPVTAGGTIHYQFSETTKGATETIGEAVVRKSQTLSVNGQAAPNFRINQVSFVGITASGNGEFRFQLECNGQAVTSTGQDIQCYDVRLDSLHFTLAENTYSGDPTQTDLDNIMTAASGGKTVDMTSNAFVAGGGTPALTNGGFITADHGDADVMVMPGTLPIDQHPHMLLVLKSGPSYLYFNVEVTTITQSNDSP